MVKLDSRIEQFLTESIDSILVQIQSNPNYLPPTKENIIHECKKITGLDVGEFPVRKRLKLILGNDLYRISFGRAKNRAPRLPPIAREWLKNEIEDIKQKIDSDPNYFPPSGHKIAADCKAKTRFSVSGHNVLKLLKKILSEVTYNNYYYRSHPVDVGSFYLLA
jgi:hypothetical protein